MALIRRTGHGLKKGGKFVIELVDQINELRIPRMAAAISYYTIFAMAPILVIVIWLLGLVYGPEAARGEIVGEIQELIGPGGAQTVQTVLESASRERSGTLATVLGFATLIVASTGVFVEIQDSLNNIWGVQPKPGQPVTSILRVRLYSFAMVLTVGFVLLVSLALSAAVSLMGTLLERNLPVLSDLSFLLLRTADFLLPLLVTVAMLALIYRLLPDANIAWKDVWVGAGITAALFTIGKYGIGLYIGQSSFTSSYGAAGSLVVVLMWVFFSSLIFLIGALITRLYANRFGSQVRPRSYAMKIAIRQAIQPETTTSTDGTVLAEPEDAEHHKDPGTGKG